MVTANIVLQYDKDDNLIREWPSALSASKELSINYQNIIRTCNGRSKSAGGFVWKYKDPSEAIQKRESKTDITNVEKLRVAKGLSQNQLAEISGINNRVLQCYEQGSRDINKAQAITVYNLAKALNCSIEDLLEL